jgi:hypothetical protein
LTKSNSTRALRPAKPYPEFPLFAHSSGRWCKKIRGRRVCFGPWDDPDAALKKYLDRKDALHAGLTPADPSEALTVHSLCAQFLTTKKRMKESNDLSGRSVECPDSPVREATAICLAWLKAASARVGGNRCQRSGTLGMRSRSAASLKLSLFCRSAIP